MKKFKIPIIILIILAVLMGAQFFKSKARQKLSGTLEMTEHALGAPVPGRLATLIAGEGSLVAKGQILATLDHFEQAQKDYNRLKDIQKTGGIDAQTVEHAYLNMTDHQIVSPEAGEVLVKVHEAGEVVAAGQAVVIVGDPYDRWVKVYVPEGKINQVKLGQPAMLKFDGLNEKVPGVVSYISPKAEFTPRNVQSVEERVTQTFAVKIKLSNARQDVHPGVSADVEL